MGRLPEPTVVHARCTAASPASAVRPAGAGGATSISTAGVAAASFDAAPNPPTLPARTWKVYAVPLSSPVTVKLPWWWLRRSVSPLLGMVRQLPYVPPAVSLTRYWCRSSGAPP